MSGFFCQPRNDNNLFLVACILFCVDALYSVWAFISSMQLMFALLFILAVVSAALFFLAYMGKVTLIAPFTALALRLLVELLINHAGRGGFFGFLGVLVAIFAILCLGGIIRFEFPIEKVDRYDIRCGKPLMIAAAAFVLLGLIAVIKSLLNLNFGVSIIYILDTLCLFGGIVVAILSLEQDSPSFSNRDEFLEYARNADLEDLIYDDDFFEGMEGMDFEKKYAAAEKAVETPVEVPVEEPVQPVETAPAEEPVQQVEAAPTEAPAEVPEEIPAEEPEEYVDINDFIQAQDQQEAETRKTEAARRREETKKKIGEDGLQILAVIRKMAELKEQGIITEAEFEKKKRELLKRL